MFATNIYSAFQSSEVLETSKPSNPHKYAPNVMIKLHFKEIKKINLVENMKTFFAFVADVEISFHHTLRIDDYVLGKFTFYF